MLALAIQMRRLSLSRFQNLSKVINQPPENYYHGKKYLGLGVLKKSHRLLAFMMEIIIRFAMHLILGGIERGRLSSIRMLSVPLKKFRL